MNRAATMVLALLVLNVLLGSLCIVVARSERRSDGLKLWGLGLLTYSAGLLITLAAFLPAPLIKIVGNALIAYSPILCVSGALAFSSPELRLNKNWTTAGYLVSVAPIIINHLIAHPLVLVDFLAPAPLANILFVIAAVALIRRPHPDARTAARFLGAIFLFAVLVWTLRMLSLWLSLGGSNDRDQADLTVALFAIAQMVVSVAATLGFLWVEVRRMESDLKRIAYNDPLTRLPNRRATRMRFADELSRASRNKLQFAMLLIDIDHFKQINDTYGHQAGDAVLEHVAAALGAEKRAQDALGRIGGEEFLMLLTDCSGTSASEAADRMRGKVAAATLLYRGRNITVTLSSGLAIYPSDGSDWDSLFSAADQRLYAAKRAGRNRIIGPSARSTSPGVGGIALPNSLPLHEIGPADPGF